MMKESEVYKKLQDWAVVDENIRAMVLTSSRTAHKPIIDIFSDYDVELYVRDISRFMSDEWLSFWADILLKWPLQPVNKNGGITRLVLFKNGTRIDFQITDNQVIEASKYDSGFKVLLDKDGITKGIKASTYSEFIIKKPTEKEFEAVVNDFFWDGTYVVKSLWRDELYFAKYMDGIIHFDYFQKMVEWYIGMQDDWSVSTNKHGRLFKRYLDADTWKEVEATFSGGSIEQNWEAFFNMVGLFSKMAKEVAEKLSYRYPLEIEKNAIGYYNEAKNFKK